MSFWNNKKVVVTGGSGFLGSFLVEKLRLTECADIFIPRSSDYDLVEMEAVKQLYSDVQPDVILHLAAAVGGIGANNNPVANRKTGDARHRDLGSRLQQVEGNVSPRAALH